MIIQSWMLVAGLIVAVLSIAISIPFFFRVVVEPNEVHIVQGKRGTTTYGREQAAGNAYYKWPHWWPFIGLQTVSLPLSVFDIELKSYAAYDKEKVPFVVDIVAFFRIFDSARAAERVSSESELHAQLESIVQGAARTILAQSEIETIMVERSTYGVRFTQEVDDQLKQWGVCTVKNIELMDLQDAHGSRVIENIMARKKSFIEKESRTEVARNMQAAQEAEIAAKQAVALRDQEAQEAVGKRTADQEKNVGIQKEVSKQEVAQQAAITAERDMQVVQVKNVRAAEIAKEVAIVNAEMKKQAEIINAQGVQQQTIIKAEGDKQQVILQGEAFRDAEKLRAEAVLAVGNNEAEVIKNKELAPVQAQIVLAQEIGSNEGYQSYLVRIRDVERLQAVGVEQAKALSEADIRVVVQAGAPDTGLNSVMDIFSGKGGQSVATMVETFAQSPVGEKVMERLGINRPNGAGRNDRHA